MNSRVLRLITPYLLAAPALGLFLIFFVWPMLLLLRTSFFESAGGSGFYRPGTWTTQAYQELLGERFGRRIISFTIMLGAAIASLSLLIGYPLACFIHSFSHRLKIFTLSVVLLPKLANVFIVMYGINLLLSRNGPVNHIILALNVVAEPLQLTHNLLGVMVAETYVILPYSILILVLALDRLDPTLIAAARGLGASSRSAFLRVTLPLTLPAVAFSYQLSLIWSLGAFVGPVLLGGPQQTTLAVLVERQAIEFSDWPRAAASAVLNIATVIICLVLYSWPAAWLRRLGETGRV